MKFTTETIRRAFERHKTVYHEWKKWRIGHHVECWQYGRDAFVNDRMEPFDSLYAALSSYWQVFRTPRGSADHWSAQRTFDHLRQLDRRWRSMRLTEFDDEDVEGFAQIVREMNDLKRITNTPSIVAISKVLHFWNPRLFLIVDGGVIWNYVLSHYWLWKPIEVERKRIVAETKLSKGKGSPCDVLTYAAFTRWATKLIRTNPEIMPVFEAHVRANNNNGKGPSHPCDLPLEEYEAGAVEWFLLGVVELPPPEIELDAGPEASRSASGQ